MPRYSNGARVELTGQSQLLEQRLIPSTIEANTFPLRVNHTTWLRNFQKAEQEANDLSEYCRYLAGDDNFRANSPADCRKVLNVKSSDADTLTALFNAGSELAGAVLDARSAISHWSQLRKWEKPALLGWVSPRWDSLGCPHGRYTSEAPCLNNRVRGIRETIEPQPGFTFLSLDVKQAEYVTWASLSHDSNLCELFLSGKDFHEEMAAFVQSLVSSWNPENLRQAGKTLNFSILYKMKPHTLAAKLGCSHRIARSIIRAYYKRASQGIKYSRKLLLQVRDQGFVDTFFGRRRFAFRYQDDSGDKREHHEIEKTLWSHHIAGTAAELVKLRQADIHDALRREGLSSDDVRLSIQMYDQLIYSIKDELSDQIQPFIVNLWNKQEPGFLPFRSTIKTGKTWGEL